MAGSLLNHPPAVPFVSVIKAERRAVEGHWCHSLVEGIEWGDNLIPIKNIWVRGEKGNKRFWGGGAKGSLPWGWEPGEGGREAVTASKNGRLRSQLPARGADGSEGMMRTFAANGRSPSEESFLFKHLESSPQSGKKQQLSRGFE